MVHHKKALHIWYIACSRRLDGRERCKVKEAIPLPLPRFYFFVLLFTSHRSTLSERLEYAKLVYRSEHDLEYSLTTIQPILRSQESPVPNVTEQGAGLLILSPLTDNEDNQEPYLFIYLFIYL